MSEFPLYDLVSARSKPLSEMAAYLRDEGRTWEEIEARRKADLSGILTNLRNGDEHPLLSALDVLETMLGSNHPLDNIQRIVSDPQSFNHMFSKGDEEQTPEEFQALRRAHIESIIRDDLSGGASTVPYEPDDRTTSWINETIAECADDGTRSIDIAHKMLNRFLSLRESYGSKYGLEAVNAQLDRLRANEDTDNLVHPNDQYIEGDILEALSVYKKRRSWAEQHTVDMYQTQDDVEVRRSAEVIGILEKWKEGAHPFLVMTEILAVAFHRIDNPLETLIDMANAAQEDEKAARAERPSASDAEQQQSERRLVSAIKSLTELRREAKEIMRSMREEIVSYRGPDTHPEFAGQIDTFIQHLEDTDEPSLSIIQGVAEAVFQPVDDSPYLKEPDRLWDLDDEFTTARDYYKPDAPLLTKIRVSLNHEQAEENERFEANKPMGRLHTQTEDEIKEPLSSIFQQRAKKQRHKNFEPLPKLTDEIHIDPSGTAMIKPYPRDQYDEPHEEQIYGTTTARITTYSVNFTPKDPSRIYELAGYVKWGLKKIPDIEPAFDVPFDYDSEPYERPSVETDHHFGKIYRNTHIQIKNDKVHVVARLDLDDVWNLYYLLEDVIEPSEQIAAAMNAARYAEERGVLMQKGGADNPYSNDNMSPENQMGSLDQENPEDYVPATMRHTLSLYALGEIDEEQLLQRLMVLADHTLAGRMVDPDGLLPSFNMLTDQSGGKSKNIVTYDDALRERTREILMIMTGASDADVPLFPALMERVAKISGPLRDKLRDIATDAYETLLSRGSGRSSASDWNAFLRRIQGLEEELDNDADASNEKEEERGLARQANIVLRDSEVGVTTDRTWRGTEYVSRSRDSIWVRKELPSALAPFLRTQHRPDMDQVLQAISYEKD